MIAVKRAYESAASSDGVRMLVDRVWPRGVTKEKLHVDSWVKNVAPSTPLRKWFGHDPDRWDEFQHRYFAELAGKKEVWTPILDAAKKHKVTLVYGARDEEHNNAVALQAFLHRRLKH